MECNLDETAPRLGRAKRMVRLAKPEPDARSDQPDDLGITTAAPDAQRVTMLCLPSRVAALPEGLVDLKPVLSDYDKAVALDFETQAGISASNGRSEVMQWVLPRAVQRRMPNESSRVRFLLGAACGNGSYPRLLPVYAPHKSDAQQDNSAAEIVCQANKRAVSEELAASFGKPFWSERIDGTRRIWLSCPLIVRTASFPSGQLRESMFKALPMALRRQALANKALVYDPARLRHLA